MILIKKEEQINQLNRQNGDFSYVFLGPVQMPNIS